MDAARRESAAWGDERGSVGMRTLRPARTPDRWGRIDSWPTTHGVWTRKRLTVYPPGITLSQRQSLGFHHNWPVVGAVAMILGTVLLGGLLPPAAAALLSAAGYGLVGVVSARVTRGVRSASRSIEVSVMPVGDGWSVTGDLALFEDLCADLRILSADAACGDLSPVDFEARWADAFQKMLVT